MDRYRPVKGWAEILFRTAPIITAENRHPVPALNNIIEEHYTPVGSWIPTEEFVHTVDIMELYQGDISELYNIPRPIQAWDVINLCPIDPPGIRTLVVVPKKKVEWYRRFNPQIIRTNDLALVARPTPFRSFRYPSWPVPPNAWKEQDDDDEPGLDFA